MLSVWCRHCIIVSRTRRRGRLARRWRDELDDYWKGTRENVHQGGSILFQTNFIITQLAMFDLLLRFDHHRRPSSGTECSVVTEEGVET